MRRWFSLSTPVFLTAVCLGVFCGPAHALRPISFLGAVNGNFHRVTPAVFRNHFSLDASLGTLIASHVYFGAAAEVWEAAGGEGLATRRLGLLSGGVELGALLGRPRHFWLVTVGAFYPFALQVSTDAGSVSRATQMPLSYRARVQVGIRMTASTALTLGVGYRLAPMPAFEPGVEPVPVTLSGFQGTLGLALTL